MTRWALVALVFAMISCASRSKSANRYDGGGVIGGAAGYAVAAEAERADVAAAPPSRAERKIALPTVANEPPPATLAPVSHPPPPDRMVHYDGYVRMRATRPDETLDAISSLAVEAGGRVDRLANTQVTVRVPFDAFDAVWAAVLALGDVLDKQVRADDITDQFRATDLRTKTLLTMQRRLVRLLARARSEEEKLALLQEITRVTEELDRTRSQLRALRDLASMSRISVDVVARQMGPQRDDLTLDGFEWIRALSPFNRSVHDDDKRIELPLPDEMVSLTKTGPFIAESPDRTVLWTMRVDNDPRGDAEFWRQAMHEALAEDFENVQTRDVGDWACLAFGEPGADKPYRWQVCLATTGRHIEVVQAYFPGPSQVERFAGRVDDALSDGGAS